MKNSTTVPLLGILALIAGLTGCARGADGDPAPAGPAKTESMQAVVLPVLGQAPGWSLKDLDGAAIGSDQLKGKVVVVDFWATWCPPCIKEVPGYTELVRRHGAAGLVIVGISLDQAGPDVVKGFAERFKVNYPLAMGDAATVAAFGGVEAIPTTFLIDREGRIRDRKVGLEATETYEKKILSLL